MSWPLFVFPALSFLFVLGNVPLLRHWALRAGYVDRPGGRKNHDNPTPPIGGLILVPVFIIISLLSGAEPESQWPFWAALLVIMAAGVLDDRYAIKPGWKFVAQFIAAGLIVFAGGANVASLGNLFGMGTVWLGFMYLPFSLIAAVLLINAINLIDGLDGLAGGTTLIALFWMLLPCLMAAQYPGALSIAILMAGVAAFLIYNLRTPLRGRASIFLGDAGSMALGLSLAWYGMTLGRAATIQPIAVAWILALPIMDTCAQFARRVSQGRHPFDADNNHFHHHFINAGITAGRATAIILAINVLLGLVGVGGMMLGVPEWVLCLLWVVTILTHIGVSLQPRRFHRLITSFRHQAQS